MTYSASVQILGGLGPALFRLLEIDGASFAGSADLRLRHFLGYWGQLAAARGAYPARTAIDPSALGRDILPNLFLVDIVRANGPLLRYRFRLIGDAVRGLARARPGQFLDEVAPVIWLRSSSITRLRSAVKSMCDGPTSGGRAGGS